MDWAISARASASAPPTFRSNPPLRSAPRVAADGKPHVSAGYVGAGGLLLAAQRHGRIARRVDVKITDATNEKRVTWLETS